ncbi:MAG: alpha/beta hydrolase [Gemmataceae bacterium]
MVPGITLRHGFVTANGVRLHYVEAGAGPPVLLLHGFPEFWYSWRRQIPALAGAGLRPIALDLRGYNQSDAPRGAWHYRVSVVLDDLAGVIRHVCRGPAFVVGHDWGGGLAWLLAARSPELVRKLAVLNAPHPARFKQAIESDWGQWLRSSYMLFFQFAGLAEWLIGASDFRAFDRMWTDEPVHEGAFSPQDIAFYKKVFRRPGALTGPLNYYRAVFRYPHDLEKAPHGVPTPTLLLWGKRDRYLGVDLSQGLEHWAPDLRVERFDASHWLQNDVPERVNEALVNFFRS